jgi:hypothetical protein
MSVLKNFGSSIKEKANPFTRLVLNCTVEDAQLGVPYFQQEEIKEAAFQSEYGCDSIHKALLGRLDHKSPVVQLKSLFLMRALMSKLALFLSYVICSCCCCFFRNCESHKEFLRNLPALPKRFK